MTTYIVTTEQPNGDVECTEYESEFVACWHRLDDLKHGAVSSTVTTE
jgi:hypothetical protein